MRRKRRVTDGHAIRGIAQAPCQPRGSTYDRSASRRTSRDVGSPPQYESSPAAAPPGGGVHRWAPLRGHGHRTTERRTPVSPFGVTSVAPRGRRRRSVIDFAIALTVTCRPMRTPHTRVALVGVPVRGSAGRLALSGAGLRPSTTVSAGPTKGCRRPDSLAGHPARTWPRLAVVRLCAGRLGSQMRPMGGAAAGRRATLCAALGWGVCPLNTSVFFSGVFSVVSSAILTVGISV